MTVRIHKVKNAGQAHAYFTEKDDYYLADKSSAQWFGDGAETLGLQGEVDPDAFKAVLDGRFGRAQVGKPGTRTIAKKDGSREVVPNHAPGWDVTFSAQKSVSVAALANRDERVIRAHDEAVRAALGFLRDEGFATRQRDKDGGYDYRDAAGMVAAMVRHSSSRGLDCQLHTHAIVANGCIDPATGEWVSLDSRKMYAAAREANNVYESEMARLMREAGYDVKWSVNASGFASAEVADIPQAACDALSSRSQEMAAWMREHGIDPKTASADVREKAALATRKHKQHMPAAALHQRWLDALKGIGYESGQKPSASRPLSEKERAAVAATAVKSAMDSVSERKSRFTERELIAGAVVFARGEVSLAEVKSAVAKAKADGELLAASTRDLHYAGELVEKPGFTTRDAMRTERKMLGSAAAIAGRRPRTTLSKLDVDTAIVKQEKATGFKFSAEQRAATHAVACDGSGLTVVQGYAGTAKTTTVLATVAGLARDRGVRVRALAPTHSAAKTLGDAIGAKAQTVAGLLARGVDHDGRREAWIVDEAGMVSAKDMAMMLQAAERAGAQVVLVGDEKQIGSVGAGNAFAQIKAALPDRVAELTDIKRQSSAELRQAIYDLIEGNPNEALGRVDVAEVEDRHAQIKAAADAYMEDVAAGKATLVVTLSNADRMDVNAEIQARRVALGEVSSAREFQALRPRDWTNEERRDAARWQAGDLVASAKGVVGEVVASKDDLVAVRDDRGVVRAFNPREAYDLDVVEPTATKIGAGDRIVANGTFTATAREADMHGRVQVGDELRVTQVSKGGVIAAEGADGRKVSIKAVGETALKKGGWFTYQGEHDGFVQVSTSNGRALEIDARKRVKVTNNTEMRVEDVRNGSITARLPTGQAVSIEAGRGARIELAYAQTANKAQGRTVDTATAVMRSNQRRLADMPRTYVALSRAREKARVITDDKARLASTLQRSKREVESALGKDGAAVMLDQVDAGGKRPTLASVKRGVREAIADMRERIDNVQRDRKATSSAKVAAEIEKRDLDTIFKGAEKIHSSIDKRTRATIKRIEKNFGIKANDSDFRRAFDNKAQRKARGYIDEAMQRRATAYGKTNDAFDRALDRQAGREAERNGTTVDEAREKIRERLLYQQESTPLTRAIDAAVAIGDRFEKFTADRRARAEAKNMDSRFEAEAQAKKDVEATRQQAASVAPVRGERAPSEPTAEDSAHWRRNEHAINPANHRTESHFLDNEWNGDARGSRDVKVDRKQEHTQPAQDSDAKRAAIYGKGEGFDVKVAVEKAKKEREAARKQSIASPKPEPTHEPRAKKPVRQITPSM